VLKLSTKGGAIMEIKRIIPCLDMKDGRVVKGVHFENLRDAADPAELAKYYSEAGADELVFLDINASHEGRKTFLDMIKRTAESATIPFCVGGGISSIEDIETILNLGASKVSINSAAVKNPDLINEASKKFGKERIVVAIDVKETKVKYWEVLINGGRIATGKEAVEWAKEVEERGAGEILLTSMDRDGVKNGYDLEITRMVAEAVSIPVIASGGAGKLEDFRDAVLIGKADAMLAASLFHFRELEIKDVKNYLHSLGIPVRL